MKPKGLLTVFSLAAMFCGSGTAIAQQSGLVNVELTNVVSEIAANIRVEPTQIPMNVRVPTAVAADVCKVAPHVLSSQGSGSGGEGCQAQATSAELDRIILRQVKENSPK